MFLACSSTKLALAYAIKKTEEFMASSRQGLNTLLIFHLSQVVHLDASIVRAQCHSEALSHGVHWLQTYSWLFVGRTIHWPNPLPLARYTYVLKPVLRPGGLRVNALVSSKCNMVTVHKRATQREDQQVIVEHVERHEYTIRGVSNAACAV